MSEVSKWIGGFLRRHRARFDPHDWPDPAADVEESRVFLQTWVDTFVDSGVTEAEADLASRLLAPTPPSWRRQHIAMVMDKVREQRTIQAAEAKPAPVPASTCCYCAGVGLTIAWHAHPSYEDRVPETTSAHCICRHGREQRAVYLARNPGSREILDFGDVLAGKLPDWLDRPPACPDLSAGALPDRPGRLRWREFAGLFSLDRLAAAGVPIPATNP